MRLVILEPGDCVLGVSKCNPIRRCRQWSQQRQDYYQVQLDCGSWAIAIWASVRYTREEAD